MRESGQVADLSSRSVRTTSDRHSRDLRSPRHAGRFRSAARGRGVGAVVGSLLRTTGSPAAFSFDRARIFTRTLAGLAAASTIWPGRRNLRMSVPALRAGTFAQTDLQKAGEPPELRRCRGDGLNQGTGFPVSHRRRQPSSRGISFSSAIRLTSADFVRACLTGLTGAGVALVAFLRASTLPSNLCHQPFLCSQQRMGPPRSRERLRPYMRGSRDSQ